MPGGRPTKYTVEIGERICELLAESTVDGITAICAAHPDLPSAASVYRWLDRHDEFRESHARACASRADRLAREGFDIIDDGRNDWVEARGGYVVNGEAVQRSKLRADFRLRVMESIDRPRWGAKQTVEHTGSINLSIAQLSDQELVDAVQGLISRGLMPGVRPDEEVTLAADDGSDLL